jgi:protease-4
MILALVLLVLLGISVLTHVMQFARGFASFSGPRYTMTVGPRLEEILLEDTRSANKLAVIEIEGVISSGLMQQGGFGMVDVVRAEFERAADDGRVKAVILKVNSPGGEVLASDEISRIISDFQLQTGKPVVASMSDLAASGGYYVSAPCRWIVANELTLTGSIGVIMSTWNYRHLMNKVGVRPEVYKSGKFKDMLSPAREPEQITPEERQMIQAIIDQTFTKFKSVVEKGRSLANAKNGDEGQNLRHDWAEFADGRILSGKDAFEVGFVDELGTLEDAYARARRLAGIGEADIVKYQQHLNLGDFLRIFGGESSRAIKIDLGIEPPKLKTGQLYFLSPTALP